MFGGTPTAAILGKDKKLRDRLNKEAENRANRNRLNKSMMETLLMNKDKKNKINNKIDVTTTKKDNLGLSPSEIREDKKRQNLGRSKDKMAPSSKIKGEKEKDLKRLEEIKKNQAAEDAAKKKKAKGKSKGPKLGGEFQGPRKNVLKRMNMGGVMKNRGGTFKGSF